MDRIRRRHSPADPEQLVAQTSHRRLGRTLAIAGTALLAFTLVAGYLAWHWSADAVRTETFAFPNGRDRLALRHDALLGQVETLTVIRDPDTPQARVIFTQSGDQPLAFVDWQDDRSALLAIAEPGGSSAYYRLLCGGDTCRLSQE